MAPLRKPRRPEDDFDWFTVTYKSIYTVVGVLVALAASAYYYFFVRQNDTAPPVTPLEAAVTVTTARFTTIEGTVRVKKAGTMEWVVADPSMTLRKSDFVRTNPGAAAEVTFFDGTVVHVRPDSLITIEETSEDPRSKRRRVAWFISSGEVNFKTVRPNVPGSQTEISTPTVRTTTANDAAGDIRVQEGSGETEVKVSQGSTQLVTKSGETRELSQGRGVRVDNAGKAGPEIVLPGVPTLLAPPHQSEVSYPDPARATTLLHWNPIPDAVAYHLMLDYSAYFNKPIVDRNGIKANSQPLILDVGKYYWRVAAVSKDGVEGPFSEFFRFAVTRPTGAAAGAGPPPPLVIDALDVRTNILQIKGRAEPGATVTVNGQRVDVMADGSFNEFITLEKPGRQVVLIRATSINGGARELRRSVVVGD